MEANKLWCVLNLNDYTITDVFDNEQEALEKTKILNGIYNSELKKRNINMPNISPYYHYKLLQAIETIKDYSADLFRYHDESY